MMDVDLSMRKCGMVQCKVSEALLALSSCEGLEPKQLDY